MYKWKKNKPTRNSDSSSSECEEQLKSTSTLGKRKGSAVLTVI